MVFFVVVLVLSGLTGWGQIAQRGTATSATVTGTTTLIIDAPIGTVTGDVLIVNIVQNNTQTRNNNLSNASSNGWTLVDGIQIYQEGNKNNDNEWWGTILYRVAQGSETSYSFLLDDYCDMAIGSIVAYYGVDATGGVKADGTSGGPFDVDPGTINLTNAASVTASTITTTTANALVIMLAQTTNDHTYNGWTTTSLGALTEGYENLTTNIDDASVGAAWAIKPTAGATGNGTATLSGSDRNGAILIALKPAPTTPPSCTTPVSPANNAINFPVDGNLTWNSVSGAIGYRIYFGTDASATNILNGTDLGNVTSYNPPSDLSFLTTYYWKIVPYNSIGSATGCSVLSFQTENISYCIPTYTAGTAQGDYIARVQLGDIDNVTVGSASPYYSYFSSLSTDLTQSNSYTITLRSGTYASANNISVWIDYNQSGTFETSEKLGNVTLPANTDSTINFTVPSGAILGQTRLHVRETWNQTDFDPCTGLIYGETEDYNVNIISPCSNPTSGGTIATAQTICSGGDPVAFTSTAPASGESGTLEYKWQSSTTNSSSGFSDIGEIGLIYDVPAGLTQTTWYKRLSKVTCESVWPAVGESNVLEVTVNPVPTASVSTDNSTICAEEDAVFNLTGISGATVTYSLDGGTTLETKVLSVVGTATVTVPTATEDKTLTLVSVTNGTCSQSLSSGSTITVNPLPEIGSFN